MSCSSTPTGSPSAASSRRTVTNAISPLRPAFTVTSATDSRQSRRTPMPIVPVSSSRPPANMRRRPGIGGRNGPSTGCPSSPISAVAGWSSRVNQCQKGGRGSPAPRDGGVLSSRAANVDAGHGSTTRAL